MNRRRLDFEQLRDFAAGGHGPLDPAVGGTPVDVTGRAVPGRRSVYGLHRPAEPARRLPRLRLRQPGRQQPARVTTTVPQQALFLMNSPFVVEQARLGVQRPLRRRARRRSAHPRRCRHCSGRAPAADELALGTRFHRPRSRRGAHRAAAASTWRAIRPGAAAGQEFAFVDR